MREIKFRAWDGKKMVFCDGLSDFAYFGDTLAHRDDFILMQYTGLKANGVEIYEGDIIENDSEWWQVIFEEGKFVCDPIQGGNVLMDLSELSDSSETWVQGNIYKNPELLTH
jgi:hypothetical protein